MSPAASQRPPAPNGAPSPTQTASVTADQTTATHHKRITQKQNCAGKRPLNSPWGAGGRHHCRRWSHQPAGRPVSTDQNISHRAAARRSEPPANRRRRRRARRSCDRVAPTTDAEARGRNRSLRRGGLKPSQLRPAGGGGWRGEVRRRARGTGAAGSRPAARRRQSSGCTALQTEINILPRPPPPTPAPTAGPPVSTRAASRTLPTVSR